MNEAQINELIEIYEGEYAKQGVEAPADKDYDFEWVKAGMKNYGYNMAYRKKKNAKDATLLKIAKALDKMSGEKKDEFLAGLGVNGR